jgi:5-methylcytosine-specific restriction endonuclease McrA
MVADIDLMLRIDNRVEFIRLPWSLGRVFTGRYALRSGKRLVAGTWKQGVFEQIRETQLEYPASLVEVRPRRTLWHFHDRFYWDDEGLVAEDIRALVLQRERRNHQKLETAHSLMRASEAGKPTRMSVPTEMRRAVFERDGGRCVECDSNFDLQYDHVLPVALGGATTVENLQLLCADCNRRKSDSL